MCDPPPQCRYAAIHFPLGIDVGTVLVGVDCKTCWARASMDQPLNIREQTYFSLSDTMEASGGFILDYYIIYPA